MLAIREAPRSGQNRPEPASRKCGATRSRSIWASPFLASANTAQLDVADPFLRTHLDAADDAVGPRCGRHLDPIVRLAEQQDLVGEV